MPFILKVRRQPMLDGTLKDIQPGDRCFKYYKQMLDAWRESPRWTTAHNLYKNMILRRPYEDLEETIAEELAWQVFFQLYIMPYEHQKREENGDI